MEKLIIKVYSQCSKSNIVRLDSNATGIVQQVQRETGLSASKIVSEMIRFAKDRIEVVEVELGAEE